MMKVLKKLLSFALCAATLFSVVGCTAGLQSNSGNKPTGENTDVQTKFPVAKDAVTGETLMFFENGQTDYKILLPENAGSVETFAANFIQERVKESTGTIIDVEYENGTEKSTEGYYIALGNTALSAPIGFNEELKTLNDEGFVLSLVDNTVFIKGAKTMGTFYGAQDFLTYEIGYESYAIDEQYVNNVSSAVMWNIGTIFDEPIFENRTFNSSSYKHDPSLAVLMRSRSQGMTGAGLDGLTWGLSAHSIASLMPPQNYPQYYNNGQICMTNPEVISIMIEKVYDTVSKAGDSVKYFELGHQDSTSACDCLNCLDSAARNGGQGGTYIVWLNQIAEGVAAKFEETGVERDFKLISLSYHAYVGAPVTYNAETDEYIPVNEDVICNEHVGVRLAPISFCVYHTYDDPNCARNVSGQAMTTFRGWDAVTDDLFFWLYNTDFWNFMFIFNDWGTYEGNAKMFESMSVTGVMNQTNHNPNAPFVALQTYLFSKFYWSADYDVEVLINNFFDAYYQEAAPYMREFFDAVRLNTTLIGSKLDDEGCFVYHNDAGCYYQAKDWSFDLLQTYQATVNKAYTAIENAGYNDERKEELWWRIRADEMFIHTYYVYNYQSYFSAEDYAALKAKYLADNEKLGNNSYAEGERLG